MLGGSAFSVLKMIMLVEAWSGLMFGVILATATAAPQSAPRGWNSWDAFGGNLNESGALAIAENMVKYLLPHGYDVLTIDEFWYSDNCKAASDGPSGTVGNLAGQACTGSADQQWVLSDAATPGQFTIAPAHDADGAVIDIYGCSTTDGKSKAYLYQKHAGDFFVNASGSCEGKNQLWSWGKSSQLLSGMSSQKCLEVWEGDSRIETNGMDLFSCNGGANQEWTYDKANQTLAVAGGGPHGGAPMCLTRVKGHGLGCADKHGRPQPDVNKWPSSAGGKGFKPFADKIHAMGLRLGIHTLRGSVSQAAISAKAPILGGGGATVDQIATTVCAWNKNWYAMDASHPAAKAWIESVYQQYADWGVDFIKNDCIFAQNMEKSNIELISGAMTKTGRAMQYSLSPGGRFSVADAKAIAGIVNIYRVTGDWHGGNLDGHFSVAHETEDLIGVKGFGDGPSFPDLDMLNPYTNTKDDEDFRIQMTLWCISRNPLIYGGDIRSSAITADDFALLTNEEVLAVQELSSKNHQVSNEGGLVIWVANGPKGETYVALMNTGNSAVKAEANFTQLGISGRSCAARDLWLKNDIGTMSGRVSVELPKSNGAALLKLSACSSEVLTV